ncbi:MAG: LOG family protein [Gemmatales bacterium]|nr:LOG family protein [Gemmatales bacterium]MDW8387792.1 LOG family protein [Gemmatales bacterium]
MSGSSAEGRPFHLAHEDAVPVTPEDARTQVSVEQLVQQIKETADKFIRDKASRGDLKMLATALRELRYALKVFAPYRHRRKVAIFGSARTPRSSPTYHQAVAFGRRMVEAGFMVVTGAASGIMEAGHVGAGVEHSLGVNILLPFEQEANPIIAGDGKLVHLKYFFTRKLMFVKESDAIALFPGGFGTLDEGFEVLTLVQTGKSHMFPIVMLEEPGGDYWARWFDFIHGVLLKRGFISEPDLSLFKITTSLDEAVEEILGFYRNYHSMRYVGERLVLRLQKPLPDEALARIQREFADILAGGTFEQTGPLPAEANESHLAHLARLRFRFDRKSLGRLRQLIDFVNRAV